jgi:PII-like signaling protein
VSLALCLVVVSIAHIVATEDRRKNEKTRFPPQQLIALRRPMELPEDALLIRIFIGESDRFGRQPLYEAIVSKAREMGMAGATVLRGPMGFGASSRIHSAKVLQLSMDLPLIVEMVDTEEKINAFLPFLDQMMNGGLVTLEKARVIHYKPGRARPA